MIPDYFLDSKNPTLAMAIHTSLRKSFDSPLSDLLWSAIGRDCKATDALQVELIEEFRNNLSKVGKKPDGEGFFHRKIWTEKEATVQAFKCAVRKVFDSSRCNAPLDLTWDEIVFGGLWRQFIQMDGYVEILVKYIVVEEKVS
jgi:hypothetical protein